MRAGYSAANRPFCSARARRLTPFVCNASKGGGNPNKTIKVTFKTPYRAHFGQCLGVVGAGELLGAWDGSKAVQMTWSPGDVWVAEIDVAAGHNTHLEYKYVVLNSNGQVSHWKPGRNYKLEIGSARSRVVVTETWDDNGPRTVEIDDNLKQNDQQQNNGSGTQQEQGSSSPSPPPSPRTRSGRSRDPSQSPSPGPEAKKKSTRGRRARIKKAHSDIEVIQQQAQNAMADLADALDRQVNALERQPDPGALDLIMGDRLLAAANSKAVALNRALRAAEALPALPPAGNK